MLFKHINFIPSSVPPISTSPIASSALSDTEFSNPQLVVIQGYSGSAEEPFITADGQYLFFDDRTDKASNPDIYYAKRINDTTFTFVGKIAGVNTTSLEAAPNMDDAGNFYFVTTRSYPQDLNSIYRGTFRDGTVTGVAPVQGLSDKVLGMLDMDAQVSPDGNMIYLSDADFRHGLPPTASDIKIAKKNSDGSFTILSNSSDLLKSVNVGDESYAPTISANGLELFFNSGPRIFVAKRALTSDPFGAPQQITAASGFVEGAYLSPDGKHLYYHKQDLATDIFSIYMLTR